MSDIKEDINQKTAAHAFGKQAKNFDDIYSKDLIIQYKRQRVREHIQPYLHKNCEILELNSGTGEDALWFAEQGFRVHATDISTGMQEVLTRKKVSAGFDHFVTTEICSFTDLDKLKNRGPYDFIFSNFAGLNCTGDLKKVLNDLPALLKPGGIATLVILPGFSMWESLMMLKGKFKTATRRWFAKNGRLAHLEGEYFKCWYYNPSYVIRHSKKDFALVKLEGLCTIVPPSYIEKFGEKYPQTFAWLKRKEDRLKSKWPWRSIGDYYIISLQKKNPE